MGLDGLAMGNLGLNTDVTSAQMANQAEQIARKELEFKVKSVGELAEDNGVKMKDKNSEQDTQFNDGFKKKHGSDESEDPQSSFNERDFEKKDPKEFSVRINQNTEMVELFSTADNKVIETINANDLMGLISRLNNASGIS